MALILISHNHLHSRADSVHDPAVWISLIFIGLVFSWVIFSYWICPCFFGKPACQSESWNACCGWIRKCCCACRPKPEEMAREINLWAEDRTREDLRLRNRRREEGMVYQMPIEGLGADRSAEDIEVAQEEEQLPQYRPRTETSEGQRPNEEILERRNGGLAVNAEREMNIDEQLRPYDGIMIAELPPAYVEPRAKIL